MTRILVAGGSARNLSLAAALAKLDATVEPITGFPQISILKAVHDYDFSGYVGELVEAQKVSPLPQLRHQARIAMNQKQSAMKSKSRR